MKISWITPSSFVDVDLPVIAELQNKLEIYWQIVVFGSLNDDLRVYVESQLGESKNVKYEYVEIPYRVFDLRTTGYYKMVLKKAKDAKADLYYTSDGMSPFGPLLYRLYIPRKKVIAACHNVSTPKGANQETYARIFTSLYLRTFKNIHVFSESQCVLLNQKYPGKNILLAPLAIKDYGASSLPTREFDEKKIVFLFFGIVSPYKRLDLLIHAAQRIYERGYKNFVVKIAGRCKAWSKYAEMIRYPELFDTRIERIPNSEVADLFAACDYFVMPYQDIAQSGAITVAYKYDLPIILSNLSQFQPYGEDGKTGYFFETGNVKDLEAKMIYVIEGGEPLHSQLKKGLNEFVEERFSTPVIAKQYVNFFESLIKPEYK